MATKNIIMLLVLILSSVLAIGVVSAQNETDSMKMAAHESITLAVQYMRSRLVVARIVGLIDSLSDAQSVLQRMRHLNKATVPFIDSDANDLKSAVLSRIASFNDLCQVGLKDVDKTIVTMLNRKLEDIMMLASNVINHVSEIKLSN